MQKLSFIIPILNEEHYLAQQSSFLQTLLQQGHEVIVVDGGSTDNSISIAKKLGCKCISTKSSRGFQLDAGAKHSSHDILLFLHADTILPQTSIEKIQDVMSTSIEAWGRFNVAFTNQSFIFKIIAWFMNKRSCLTGIVTGDQTFFINRTLYFEMGGFEDVPIMEDIQFSKKLKKYSRPICMQNFVITSSRKWEQQGILNTIFLMWRMRVLYFLGVKPEKLVKVYYSS